MALQGSLPLIAKALGRKYGLNVVISSSVQVPCTTGKTIYLPVLPDGQSRETAALLNGFIDHEAGHVRYTDFESYKGLNKLEQMFANVLEDPRVERLISRAYPGCRFNLDAMYEAMASEGRNLPEDPLSILSMGLLDKLLLEVNQRKGITEEAWLAAEMLFGTDLTQAILDIALPVALSDDPLETAKGAKAIVELLRQQGCADDQDDQEGDADSEEEGDEDGTGTGTGQGSPTPGQGQPASSKKGSATPGRQMPAGNSGKVTGASQGAASGGNQPGSPSAAKGQDVPGGLSADTEGTHTGLEAVEAVLDSSDAEIEAVLQQGIGEKVAEEIADLSREHSGSYSDEAVVPASWRSDPQAVTLLGVEKIAKALRYRLEDTLQHRQEEGYYTRTTGTRMLRRRVGLYESGARKVFKFKEDQEKLNTAVYVTCDISGSMNGVPLRQAQIATICIGDALHGMEGLAYQVSSFDTRVFTYPEGWNKARQQIAATPAQGGTLFSPALVYGLDWLSQAEQERKVLILITDGEPGDAEATKTILRSVEGEVEMYALAIAAHISPTLRVLYGNRVQLVDNINLLPSLLGTLIEQSI